MTSQVINELKKYTVGKKNTEKTEISVLAINRLIFALEEEESCEDCISRADALKDLALTNGKDDVYRMLCKLPSVHPTEKVGKWIPGGLADDFGNRDYECSYCHYMDNHNDCKIVPYCWHCGAKMEGGAND